jgi:ribosome-binding protein aMBF1 (putative translation factor)
MLNKLTKGEHLFILRRRENKNQIQKAQEMNMKIKKYIRLEKGKPDDAKEIELELLPHEQCVIHRRRRGYSQAAVAKELGCSRHWLNLMEHGTFLNAELIDFWEKQE